MITRKIMSLLMLLMLVLLSGVLSAQDSTSLRFVHVIPEAPAVDVFVDGELTVTQLSYGEASNYINVPVGSRALTVLATADGSELWTQEVDALADIPQVFVASSASTPQFNAYEDDLSPLPLGNTRFKAIHAIENAPPIDLLANGDAVASGLEYNTFIGTFDVPTAVYALTIFPTGESADAALLPETPFSFTGGTSEIIIAYGTPDNPQVLQLSSATTLEDEPSFVRVAHTVVDAPEVDIYVDGTLLIPALAFGEVTEHLALPGGDYTAELRVAGESTSLLEADLSLTAGGAVTVAALGTPDSLALDVFADEIGEVGPDTAVVSVINSIPGESSATVTLADDTVLVEDIGTFEAGEATALTPTIQAGSMVLTIGEDSATLDLGERVFYGGVYYNAIILNGTTFDPPTLLLAPTSLSQEIGSAPGADEATIVEAELPPTAVAEATEVVQETVPTTEPTTEVVETPLPPQPTPIAAEEDGNPVARILLDPGVNLQLRQFPDRNALSLGLAPSGSFVEVLGREGQPVDINGEPLTDEDGDVIEFEDPAEGLTEDEDISEENTWVFFEYTTPDGGVIQAWNLALYLDIEDAEGENVRLADLPTIPNNRAGEALATAVTPPPVPEERVTAQVFNLDPGVSLNVRRNPDDASEVLAQVPSGTIMEVIGRGESGNWAFISYATSEGGTVTGWVSEQYIQYFLNGNRITIEDLLEEDDVLGIADEELIGEVSAGTTPQVVEPTPDPLDGAFVATVNIDADANLNLRRDPSDQAEVLARIPSGTSVVVLGRTDDSTWLETTFENQQGWIAAGFVVVTLDGNTVPIEDIPVTLVRDAESTAEPTEEAPTEAPEEDEADATEEAESREG